MARWIFSLFLMVGICFLFLGSRITLAQSTATPTPSVSIGEATAVAVTALPGVEQPSDDHNLPGLRALVLTLRDTGRTFTVPVNTLIILQIPRTPFSRLSYNPAILQLIDIMPMPEPLPGGGVQPEIYPAPGWRLIAIHPGVSSLSLGPEPCRAPPCPKMPAFDFHVTIIVRGVVSVTPFPPRPPIVRSDIYVGTVHLNQTIAVQVGQTVTLELPFLSPGRAVQVQFNTAVLRPLPGQNLNYAQPGGWRFVVAQAGTTSLMVLDDSSVLFRVTLTTSSTGVD
jgi:hypothetical protein